MFRRLAGLTPAIPLAFAPVAFADDKIKSIYDDSVGTNLPGTTSAPKAVTNAVTNIEAKIDDKFQPETVNANGYNLTYNETIKDAVASARTQLESLYEQSSEAVSRASNTLFRGERSVTNTLSGLRSNQEELMPASIYVLVATLTGTVVSRRRNILLRFAVPALFGVGAFAYFLPQTYQNTASYVYKLEKERTPALANAQDQAAAQLSQAKIEAQKAVDQSETTLKRSVHQARTTVERWTGLDFSGKANK